jgi:hypothetical protein
MIIDLTVAFNFVHSLWDGFGIILGCMLVVFVPVVILIASLIKIAEHKKSKLEKGSE